jgi:hypothetical protein
MKLPFLQDIIHKLEVGGGLRFFRVGLTLLALLGVLGLYDWRAFRNMGTQEAMDAAQVGRNLAQGKGYSTFFVRPFSIYLLQRHARANPNSLPPDLANDTARLKGMHPDLANPPVYPVLLAGLMKVLPFRFDMPAKPQTYWNPNGLFARYEPDFLIALFNQVLLYALIVVVFFLARRLFDRAVAWLSAGLLLGTELLWRFSVSGLSTLLLLLIFMGLVWTLVLLESEVREPKRGPAALLILAGLAGAVTAVGGLTRYSFAWLIIPVLVFVVLYSGPRRVNLALTTFLVFAGVVAPWVVRNYHLSGTPFGTAGYAILQGTFLFPEHRLPRSLDPDLTRLYVPAYWFKLTANLRQIVQNDLPRLGGNWFTAFFLVGLMVGFRNPALRRLRVFLLMCLGVLVLTQALGRTQLSDDSPEINSENLLVLLVPLILVYGVSLFLTLLEQVNLPGLELRYLIIGATSLVACLPLIFVFLPPETSPVVWPPYNPPAIQHIGKWMDEKELTMSDVPWAMAWYGRRQSVWLTLRATPDKDAIPHEDFFAISDYQKPITMLYLTPQTMDSRFLSQWMQAGEISWGTFVVNALVKGQLPASFPIRKSPGGLNGQLVLTDQERWQEHWRLQKSP